MKHISEAPFREATDSSAPLTPGQQPWVVMKFGGTSVTGIGTWQNIAQLLRNRHDDGLKTLVVHSALANVSDLLERICACEKINDNVESIVAIHQEQATLMGLDVYQVISSELSLLNSLAQEHKEQPDKVNTMARIMALGELMSTALGAAYLQTQGIDAQWIDARTWLKAVPRSSQSERAQFLSAVCEASPDAHMQRKLATSHCVVTQGFIAHNEQQQTVLLGRGGSDTSAAYFSAKLQARRLEIWTDVAGMFSADPRIVPSARTLTSLDYEEAQEIAATGGSVLHPRCLTAPASLNIPVYVRNTRQPHLPGTYISRRSGDSHGEVKGVSYRTGLKLISLDNIAMWQEVGFLAQAFTMFKDHDIAIDLISTSESNVTVSIDPVSDEISDNALNDLLAQLQRLCQVTIIADCTSVSLVGRKIRTVFHKLGPAMGIFSEHKIHLLSLAANDLNFTVVVDQDQGERLMHKLHDAIIGANASAKTFGLSWSESQPAAEHSAVNKHWWYQHRNRLLSLMHEHDSAYVYHADTIRERARTLRSVPALNTVLYAMKANSNRQLLNVIKQSEVSFECVSPGELQRLFELFPDIDPQRILFTPNFASRQDYQFGLRAGVRVTLDNLFVLRHWSEDFKGREIFVRLDPGQGRGHHELVRTAGAQSKFGVPLFELDELKILVDQAQAKVVGIHAHSGSGIMDATNWNEVGHTLSAAASRFEHVQIIDLGGGLGVPEKPHETPLDISALSESLNTLKMAYPDFDLWMEPGRFLVAESGVLLAKVTQTKGKGAVQYVGVATGMNSLIRPALYGAYHEIVNLSRLGETATERYTVVGPNCETGDRLGLDRMLPVCHEGDVLLINNTGAYGYAMSSKYNLREPAVEIVI